VTLLYLLTFSVTAILFLRWTYLIKKNVLTLSSSKQAVSPGWSVGYYFIPVLTLEALPGAQRGL
jgi:hypothetical protein